MANNHTKEDFVRKVEEKGFSKNFEFIGEYTGIRNKIQARCVDCGKISNRLAFEFYYKNCCTECAKLSRRLSSISEKCPELLKFIVNTKDFALPFRSHKKIEWKCTVCGTHSYRSVQNVTRRGFKCPECGEGISFPNRLMRNILQNLKIEFSPEKTFDWARSETGRLLPYDFYVPDMSLIIEMMGGQHKRPVPCFGGVEKFSKRQQTDIKKEEFARLNGIKYYIKIDCEKDNLKSILFEIYNSELKNLFNFEDLDEFELEKSLFVNTEFLMCINEFNTKNRTINLLSKELGIHNKKMKQYIELGAKLGLCDYSEDKISVVKKKYMRERNGSSLPVIQYDILGNFIEEYCSAAEASRRTNVLEGCITASARCDAKTAGGFIWRYKHVKYSQTINEYVNSVTIKNLKHNEKRSVVQYSKNGEIIRRFSSIASAMRETGVNNISYCASGRIKTAGGYVWKYAE